MDNKTPWRKYSQFGPIVDLVDQAGRLYLQAEGAAAEEFQPERPGDTVLEVKLPRGRGLEFPEVGDTLLLRPFGVEDPRGAPVTVEEMWFAPRGATGVCVVRKTI